MKEIKLQSDGWEYSLFLKYYFPFRIINKPGYWTPFKLSVPRTKRQWGPACLPHFALNIWIGKICFQKECPLVNQHGNGTWTFLKMYSLLEIGIFHCRVSLPECNFIESQTKMPGLYIISTSSLSHETDHEIKLEIIRNHGLFPAKCSLYPKNMLSAVAFLADFSSLTGGSRTHPPNGDIF